jgi:precorrin-2 dehydrogenase/sirohydrochlorin ferrochelatase
VNHNYYPVALNLLQQNCLVVGGGEIAEGKLDALIAAGASLTVVSPEVRPRIAELSRSNQLTLYRRVYAPSDLDGMYLVIAATDDRAVNARIAADARAAGILVNAVDDPPNCDFFAVAVVRRGDLQVAISTNGRSPAFARWMRETLDESIPSEYGDLLGVLGEVRDAIRVRGAVPPYERWRAAITDSVLDALHRGDRAAARDGIWAALSNSAEHVTILSAGDGN